MAIYIDMPLSKILANLEGSIKGSQNDLGCLHRALDNNESPAAAIDSLEGGMEDLLSYCKDIRVALNDIKGVL